MAPSAAKSVADAPMLDKIACAMNPHMKIDRNVYRGPDALLMALLDLYVQALTSNAYGSTPKTPLMRELDAILLSSFRDKGARAI